MRNLIVIALLVALTGAATVNKVTDTKSILAEIDKDTFGNTIISAISLNLASKAPVEELNLMLDQVISQLDTDQAAADAKNATDQATCDETLASFNKQIAALHDTITAVEKATTDNTEILEQAHQDLDQASDDFEETVKSIAKNKAEREEEHAKWEATDFELTETITAIDEATKLIQHMIHGVSFSQIKSRYDKVMEKLSNNKTKHASLFKPVITALSQLATKLNYDNVQKILELLTNIRAALVENQETGRAAEEKSQADWEALDTHLNDQKKFLSDKKARLTALIGNTEVLLEQLNKSHEAHQVELENLEESLAAQESWCNQQSTVYARDTTERAREVEILTRLQEHIQEKFGAMTEFIQERE